MSSGGAVWWRGNDSFKHLVPTEIITWVVWPLLAVLLVSCGAAYWICMRQLKEVSDDEEDEEEETPPKKKNKSTRSVPVLDTWQAVPDEAPLLRSEMVSEPAAFLSRVAVLGHCGQRGGEAPGGTTFCEMFTTLPVEAARTVLPTMGMQVPKDDGRSISREVRLQNL